MFASTARPVDYLAAFPLPPLQRRRVFVTDNIPLLSWIALCGRCRLCKQRISFRYPARKSDRHAIRCLLFRVGHYLDVPRSRAWA